MNESRYIELLNLYVDHQLSPAEASELEAEIARNPERRKTYQQYCRMQKACTVLFESEKSHAPESKKLSDALRDADRKIVGFPAERSGSRWLYYSAGVAAMAACATFVVVHFKSSPEQRATRNSDIATVAAPAATDVAQTVNLPANLTNPAPVEKKPRQSLYTVFSPARSNDVSNSVGSQMVSDTNPAGSYSWMNNLEMTPVSSISNAKLTMQPMTTGTTVLSSRKPVQNGQDSRSVPLEAWQFQR